MKLTFHNPATISATSQQFEITFKYPKTGQAVIATTVIPAFKLKHGKFDVEFETDITLGDEDAVGTLLSNFFNNGGNETIIAEYTAKVKAMGITFTSKEKTEMLLGSSDTQSEDSKSQDTVGLVQVNFQQADNAALIFDMNFQYNTTNEQFIAHLPDLYVDMIYNNSVVGNATIPAWTYVLGTDPFSTSIEIIDGSNAPLGSYIATDNIVQIQNMVNSVLNKKPAFLTMRGSPYASDDCALQRIMKKVQINFNLTQDRGNAGNSGSFASIGLIEVSDVTDQSATIFTEFSTDLKLSGTIPTIKLDVKESNTLLANIDINANLSSQVSNKYYSLNISLLVNDFVVAGQLLEKITRGDPEVLITVSGSSSQGSSVLSKILSGFVYETNVGTGGGVRRSVSRRSSGSISLSQLVVVGQRIEQAQNNIAPIELQIDLGLNIGNSDTHLKANFPSMSVSMQTLQTGQLAYIILRPVTIDNQGPSTLSLTLWLYLTDPTNAVSTTNLLFEGSAITLSIAGKPQGPQDNLLQRVLNNWSYSYALDPAQSPGGSQSVKGGVMPVIDSITILNTTPDTLKARLAFNLDGFGFKLVLGHIFGNISYNNFVIAQVEVTNLILLPDSNAMAIDVILTAQYSRATMEDFLSRYVFGQPLSQVTMHLTIDNTNVVSNTSVVDITYNVSLPTAPGGSGTDIIGCVELASMTIDVYQTFSGQCSLSTTLNSLFHNPMPVSFVLASMSYNVYFNNTVGAICDPFLGCRYPPKNNVLLTSVVEPGPIAPTQNPLPLSLAPNASGKIAMRMTINDNEVCFRLAAQSSVQAIYIDILNGLTTATVQQFSMTLKFAMYHYFIGAGTGSGSSTGCNTS